MNGTGDDDCLGWVGRVGAAERYEGRDLTIYNLGIRRDTSRDIKRRWRDEAAIRLPKEYDGRLVFSFGANDTSATPSGEPRVSEDEAVENAAEILTGASGWLPTILIGPTPVVDRAHSERIERLTARFSTVCAGLKVPFLSPILALSKSGTWAAEAQRGDGAHPNKGGYSELAAIVREWPVWQTWMKGL